MSGTVPVTWMRGSSAAELGDLRRRRAADDGERGLGPALADQRQDFARRSRARHPRWGASPWSRRRRGRRRWPGGGAVGREEVIDVDAGGDFGDAGDVEEAAHLVGVGLGDGDDVAGCAADAALVVVHAIGLEFEVGAAQRVAARAPRGGARSRSPRCAGKRWRARRSGK